MSRMTKFLRQKCLVEVLISENGKPKLNEFGEFQYAPPIAVRCRHEMRCKDIQTPNGSIARVTSTYYFDESQPIEVDYLIDGKVVVQVVGYTNALGKIEGYEVYV